MTIENITTSTCTACNGEREIIRAGIRTDCPACDGFGVIVSTFTDSELAPIKSEQGVLEFETAHGTEFIRY